MKKKNEILSFFKNHYCKPADYVLFAPGRANIIGEHTDYNEGFVLPFAISKGLWFAAKKNDTSIVNIIACDVDQKSQIHLENMSISPIYDWSKYFLQVLMLVSKENITGIDVVFGGDLPIGAGVSSSSAIICGFIALLNQLFDLKMDANQLLDAAITAERGQGVRGGIMDQYTIFNGKANQAILLDCRSNLPEYLSLDLGKHKFYLINTKVKHNLISTDYNNRRADVDKAVAHISTYYKPIKSLRDVNIADLIHLQSILDDTLFRRVSFVVQENDRVLKTKVAFKNHQFDQLGILLYASHDGLSQMYEVSCDELDWLVNYTLDKDEFLGARMMGGGFGGCTINLTSHTLSESKMKELSDSYFSKFGLYPDIFEVSPADGILAMGGN
ncbi:MAG: galactokinase [Saprospiraceae bacterium]|jgi:galactokinase